MSRTASLFILMLICSGVLGVNHGLAACLQSDLQGTWQIYTTGESKTGLSYSFGYSYGKIIIAADGTITLGSLVDDEGAMYIVTGGRLSITSACIIRGTIHYDGDYETSIVQGTIDRGKTVVAGVWKATGGGRGSFTSIKR